MAVDPDKPFNREEMYLAKAAGEGTTVPDEPWSRKEAYLDKISGRMDGIDEKIAALATDISLKGSVASQADLPETAAVGDAYITEDTGVMYVYVGESGTEPWVALGGSSGGDTPAKTLSSDDYNWPEDNPDGVALWKLPGGFYNVPVGVSAYVASNYSAFTPKADNYAYFITKDNNRTKIINGSTNVNEQYVVNATTGSEVTISATNAGNRSIIVGKMVVDNLTSTSSKAPLSASQGKVLNDKFGGMQLVKLTQAQYDALATKDPNTLYIIKAA